MLAILAQRSVSLNINWKHRILSPVLCRSHSVSVSVGDSELQLSTGKLARFASGAVVASQGDNAVLATCVYRTGQPSGLGFVPLTVDFKQSAAAVGKIPTNYLRRELSQSDADILASRIIDRTLRPLLPKEWRNETQINCKPLSLDDDSDGVLLGINAAVAAIHVSSVPFDGPVGAVRLALVDGKIVINPSRHVLKESKLDMVLAGCSGQRTVMVEMDGEEVSLDEIQIALSEGFESIDKILYGMNELREISGKKKENLCAELYPPNLINEIRQLCDERLYYVLTDITHDKTSRDNAIKEIGADVLKSLSNRDPATTMDAFSFIVKQVLRNLALDMNLRCDGRSLKDFRPITINVDVYKKLHGSALFQRGQTQVLSTVTFDSPAAAFHPDSISQLLGAQRKKMFMLHYEFPGYATNEISSSRSVNRREQGHGALAEKALKHVVPKDFPYSIRLACQVLESNGSSSMASACAGSLAMFDAGVPLKAPVAGVAIGLITDEENPDDNYKVLTDILGIEDYAGDMDFKISGTSNGFTAMQLDVKIAGMTRQQLSDSLLRGREGLNHVLGVMSVMRDRPRDSFKPTVPVIEIMKLEIYKRQVLFRGGGINAKMVEAETGVKISQEDESHINLFAPNKMRLEEAKALVQKITSNGDQPQFLFGQMVQVDLVEMMERGVMVRIQGAGQPVFIPNSQLHPTPLSHSSASGLQVGQKITVQWLGRDSSTGKIRLSRKVISSANLPSRTVPK